MNPVQVALCASAVLQLAGVALLWWGLRNNRRTRELQRETSQLMDARERALQEREAVLQERALELQGRERALGVACDECKAPIEAERGWRLALTERPFRQYRLCSWACTQAVSNRGGLSLPTQDQSA